MKRKLISSDEAVEGVVQHTKPCSDCPWSRDALPGWLGGSSTGDWVRTAHSDTVVDCHAIKNQQCAGIAIYRRNVCKLAYSPNLKLEADKVKVFASPMEFTEHHERGDYDEENDPFNPKNMRN